MPLVGLGGIPGPAARQNWLAERRNVSWKVAGGGHCLSAIFGVRRSGRLRPEDHRFSQVPPLFAKLPHGHMPCRSFRWRFFDILRAPYADFSPPCTALGKKVPWRSFQGIPRCGSLAKIYSVLHGIVQVSRYSS